MSETAPWSDEAFTAVFDALYPGLCRYLECMVGRSGAAQEIAQECLLRLYRAGPARVAGGEERFWVYRVASNLALNELRRLRTRRRLLAAVPPFLRRASADPHDLAERSERDARLAGALARLPDGRRAALLLREQEGLSYAEIAAALGVGESKVKVDIFRARRALRDELATPGGAAGLARAGSR